MQDANLRGERGPDGKIPLWIEAEQKWIRAWAPDAREMLNCGYAALDGPEDKPAPPPAPQATSAPPMTTTGTLLEDDEG